MRRLTWMLLVLVAFQPVANAAAIDVEAQCPWIDREGYTPIVLTVRSATPTATVVTVEANLFDNRTTMTIAVPAGAVLSRTLLLPGATRGWGSSIDLRWSAPGVPSEQLSVSPHGFRDFDVVVLDPEDRWTVKESRDAVAAAFSPRRESSGGAHSTSSYADTRFTRWSADALPDRWQGLPAWLTLVTTAAGERALTDSQRAAVAAWTQAGGRLFVTDAAQLSGWQRLAAQVAVVSDAALIQRISHVRSFQERSAVDWPVPGTGRAPVYGFISIALGFSLIVGPLNLWWCARQGRRHLLLITTPVLSVAACVMLLMYGLVSDGLGIQRAAVQVVMLDQAAGRAATWTSMSIFAGLAPSPLTLDQETLLTVQDPRSDRRQDQQSAVALSWTATSQVASGWIPSRTNRQLTFASVQPERRRLMMVKNGEGWQVTNGFDLVLEDFDWKDASGRPWHLAGSLAAGAQGSLTAGAVPNALALPLGRLPTAAVQAGADCTWTARFSGALLAIPGPAATDAEPVMSWVMGHGALESAASAFTPAPTAAPAVTQGGF